ncbi:MAG: HAD family hydrolase [Blastocatellia bacterium]
MLKPKSNSVQRPAIFADRDGTLIEEVNFLSRIDELRIFDFTFDALRALKSAGYLILVITNQSGIGRGIFRQEQMLAIHQVMQERLGGMIDKFYFCPHLPHSGCICRKPGRGMIDQAMADFDIDLRNSWVVGDKEIDVLTGKNFPMNTAMVLTGYGRRQIETIAEKPTITADNFAEAVQFILSMAKQGASR